MRRIWFIRLMYMVNISMLCGLCAAAAVATNLSKNFLTDEELAGICKTVAQNISVEGWDETKARQFASAEIMQVLPGAAMDLTLEAGVVKIESSLDQHSTNLLKRSQAQRHSIDCSMTSLSS